MALGYLTVTKRASLFAILLPAGRAGIAAGPIPT